MICDIIKKNMVFDNVSTEIRAKKILLGAYKKNKLPGAYIFYGQNNEDMLYFAQEFACLLNCDDAVCHKCLNCKKIMANTHPDFMIVRPDPESKKKIVKIDGVKEMIDAVKYGPSEGKYFVVCIESADTMEDPAANCLLKTLEEPPRNVIFILLASGIDAIKKTILSRCQTIIFNGTRTAINEPVALFEKRDISSLLDFSSLIAGRSREIDREEVIAKLGGILETYHKKRSAKEAGIVITAIKDIKKMANVRLALDVMAFGLGGHLN